MGLLSIITSRPYRIWAKRCASIFHLWIQETGIDINDEDALYENRLLYYYYLIEAIELNPSQRDALKPYIEWINIMSLDFLAYELLNAKSNITFRQRSSEESQDRACTVIIEELIKCGVPEDIHNNTDYYEDD